MVIMTAKLSKGKLIAALVLIAAVVIAAIVICNSEPSSAPQDENLTAVTNDDRLAFLAGYGWSVNVDPVDTQQVRIPTESTEVFDRYNDLQKSQGFDLTQYAGQTATRYVYQVLNYEAITAPTAQTGGFVEGQTAPEAEAAAVTGQDAAAQEVPFYATVLVCQDRIIGGDIASADPTGVMHGFAKP